MVLTDAFATDPDRLAQFKREAQILASLNHPNIAAIYGLEAVSDLAGAVTTQCPAVRNLATICECLAIRGERVMRSSH